MIEIRRLDGAAALRSVSELADVLVDCVEGGASVSFMAPFPKSDAEAFFRKVADGVAASERILIAAFSDGRIVGTVQVLTAMPPNQPHRADVAKLLVTRAARSQGIGRMLMEKAEAEAIAAGKTLLVLDTASGHAERLYTHMGWTRLGVIPGYAYNPDGTLCDTVVFWKALSAK